MPKPLSISWHQQALARRLQRHGLAAPLKNAHPADAAAAMCGVHAQILSAAELSIAIRSTNVTRADIHDALWKDHSLIKTFGPRGTVHLLPAEDLPMWTGALSAIPGQPTTLPKGMAMTSAQTEDVIAAIADALTDAVAALAPVRWRRRPSRRSVLRPQSRPQRHLHQPRPLAAKIQAR